MVFYHCLSGLTLLGFSVYQNTRQTTKIDVIAVLFKHYKGAKMRYKKSVDIWQLSDKQIKKLQVGQWVFAGDTKNIGRFLGVKKSNTVVVAWHGNASFQKSYKGYIQTLLNYARG
jgi:hypothetical protein